MIAVVIITLLLALAAYIADASVTSDSKSAPHRIVPIDNPKGFIIEKKGVIRWWPYQKGMLVDYDPITPIHMYVPVFKSIGEAEEEIASWD